MYSKTISVKTFKVQTNWNSESLNELKNLDGLENYDVYAEMQEIKRLNRIKKINDILNLSEQTLIYIKK